MGYPGDRNSEDWMDLIKFRNAKHDADFDARCDEETRRCSEKIERDLRRDEFHACMIILGFLVAGALVVWGTLLAHAEWSAHLAAEWETIYPGGVPDNVRSWFKSVPSPHGVPCCDISDGHHTDEEIRPDGTTWVPHPFRQNELIQVPPESIVFEAGNPTGRAVIWWVRQGSETVFVRCFVHGAGV